MGNYGVNGKELARLAGCSPSHISRLATGKAHPSPRIAEQLDRILGADGELARAATAERPAELPLQEMIRQAAEFSRWAETGHAGPSSIAIVDDEITRITREYSSGPPASLILRGLDTAGQIRTLLRQHQRLRHARDLYVAGARCYSFLACALADIGERSAAAAHARTALVLGEESGHGPAVAIAMSAMSKCAFWEGARKTAAEYARAGYEAAAGDRIAVLLACQEADAAPVPQAGDAIDKAWAALDAAQDDDWPPGMYTCRPTRVACYTMTLGLRRDDLRAVMSAYGDAQAAMADGEKPNFGTLMQLRLSAALAYLRAGDPGAAAGELGPLLALPPDMRLATYTGKLRLAASIATSPAYRGDIAARQLAEQLRAYLGPEAPLMPYPLAIGASR